MRKFAAVVISLLFVVLGTQASASSKSEIYLQKTEEARKLLDDIELSFETKSETRINRKRMKSKTTGKLIWVSYKRTVEVVSEKEIALAAWDPIENKFHIIRVMIPYSYNVPFTFEVMTKGYDLAHVSGRGPSKLVFEAKKNGAKLIVMAYKHWWVSPGYSSTEDPKVFEKYALEIVYSPYAPDFYDEEIILKGSEFLFAEIAVAKDELKKNGVMSKTFPDKPLSEVIPDDYIFNLGHNEQMDHGKFSADPRLTAEEISIEYALNGRNAFRWIASSANARGPFQFTNSGFGKNLGTYDYVVRDCSGAKLMKDFTAGTQDLQNMIKAAICLLDLELSKMPKDVVVLYEKDYRVAAAYPSACYNGGCGKAVQLYNWLRVNKKQLTSDSFDFPVSAIGHPETRMYLIKQTYLWGYTDRIKEKLFEQIKERQ